MPSPLETHIIAVSDRAPETTEEVLDQHSDLGEAEVTDSELLDALTESTELKSAEPRPVRYSPRPLRGEFDWGYALDNNSRQVRGQWRRTQLGEMLHRYKVRGDKELAPQIVDALADFYKSHPELDEAQPLLVTVPPSGDPTDPNSDSCHTTVELAQLLVQKVNLSLATDVLAKSRPTTPQREQQTLQKKQENVKGAFYVAHPEAVAGRSILILDDLADSGSTLSEAARALKEAGAASVFAVTITKSTLRPHNAPRRGYHHRREPSSSPSE
jgi:predicted amidophosphoribosyltransferase